MVKLDIKIKAVLIILFSWIFLGTVLFYWLEDWTLIQAFYFSVTTLTTVGYGDFRPSTDLTRLITSFYILFGVAIVLAAIGFLGRKYFFRRVSRITTRVEKIKERVNNRKKKKKK